MSVVKIGFGVDPCCHLAPGAGVGAAAGLVHIRVSLNALLRPRLLLVQCQPLQQSLLEQKVAVTIDVGPNKRCDSTSYSIIVEVAPVAHGVESVTHRCIRKARLPGRMRVGGVPPAAAGYGHVQISLRRDVDAACSVQRGVL